jgi:hypothetical protein
VSRHDDQGDAPMPEQEQQQALAVVPPAQGQLVAPGFREVPPLAQAQEFVNNFDGMSNLTITDEELAILNGPVPEDQVEVKPDGIVYLPQVFYRQILTKAFRPGRWALAPRQPPKRDGENVLYFGALYVRGVFVSEAVGECQCRFGMSYASALEGARSDCLTRVCKDLLVAKELWDPSWREAWLEKYALKSWVAARDGRSKDKFFYWRKDREIPADVKERGDRPQPARSGERWDPEKGAATQGTSPTSPPSQEGGAPPAPKAATGTGGQSAGTPTTTTGGAPGPTPTPGQQPPAAQTPGTPDDLAELKKLLASTFTAQHRRNWLKKYWPHTGGDADKLKLFEQTDAFNLLYAWDADKVAKDKDRTRYNAAVKKLMDSGRVPTGEAAA